MPRRNRAIDRAAAAGTRGLGRPPAGRIARFRVRHEQALARTFTQVLGLCARAGLVSVGLLALDGTAIAADAAWALTRTHASIREEVERILGEAAETDAREDQQFGQSRGDEMPADLINHPGHLARLRRCQEELEAEQARAEQAHREHLQRRAE
jgi:hypothetical protein